MCNVMIELKMLSTFTKMSHSSVMSATLNAQRAMFESTYV